MSVLLALVFCAAAQPADVCAFKNAFWEHVYTPQRLAVQDACVSVTGVIMDATGGARKDGLRHEPDGDSHGWLRLDAGQAKYLDAGNVSHEGGNLVFEVVCLFAARQTDAEAACKGYASDVKVPPVGTRVRMTGSWVRDDNHAHWFEIHPVFAIEVLAKEK